MLDRGWFEVPNADPGRFDGEPLRAYNVPPDALLVNFKAVRLLFAPDGVGRAVRVIAEPQLANVDVSATVRGVEGVCGDWRRVTLETRQVEGRMLVEVVGAMSAAAGSATGTSACSTTASTSTACSGRCGPSSAGRCAARCATASRRRAHGRSPSASRERGRGDPRHQQVQQQRDGAPAVPHASAETMKLPGRADRSPRAVQSHLASRGIEAPELVLENGSGLSRVERISAAGLGKVLIAAWRSPVMPEFVASLPLVAHDGTMRRRLRDQSAAGRGTSRRGRSPASRASRATCSTGRENAWRWCSSSIIPTRAPPRRRRMPS